MKRLFSRRKKDETAAEASDAFVQPAQADGAPDPAAAAEETATDAPATEPMPAGPFDIADAPEGQARIDFGGLQVLPIDGLQISVDAERETRRLTGLNLVYRDTLIQLQAFAAPRRGGLWEDVRGRLRASLTAQDATTETRQGEFGTELHARIPVSSENSQARTYRPMRFIGVDGPRWMLRAVVSGQALRDDEIREDVERIIRSTVVVRGSGPMAPTEVIELSMPGATTDTTERNPYADVAHIQPGPAIAETR
ncbi:MULTISPECIES: DUF3710 domain-containing protein [Helcobacillus]|uniref:DUF3710 domain-containing protein n=1 Tax=Helcobacillus massiliensis TaxID=521392 RepID=A0A839QY19_9MICO|nr:hypothetical protein [Helcobacillus massiliensis]MCG7426482.1 DUF3710 domain-containing protein [Helcobacillus sp. ACRRO]